MKKVIDEFTKMLKPYKKDIVAHEAKKGVIMLSEGDEIYQNLMNNSLEFLKKNGKTEADRVELLKAVLKNVMFGNGVGVALVQKNKIVLRGDFHQESLEDLVGKFFDDEEHLNDFIYKTAFEYLKKKVNPEFLTLEKLLNHETVLKQINEALKNLVETNAKVKHNFQDSSSIKLSELKSKNSKTSLKIAEVATAIFTPLIKDKDGAYFGAIADFLIRSVAKATPTQLKYIQEFFKNITRNEVTKQLNFSVIKRNASSREKYIIMIDEAKKKIKEAEEKENTFIEKIDREEARLKTLEPKMTALREELEATIAESKEAFEKREEVRKKPNGQKTPEYQALSNTIKSCTSKKAKLDADIKKLDNEIKLCEQSIQNTKDNKDDYMKLLPELIGVQTKKIKELESEIKQFEKEYVEGKTMIIEKLIVKR
jgi:uncharacterized protein YdcH (DUF465 family)